MNAIRLVFIVFVFVSLTLFIDLNADPAESKAYSAKLVAGSKIACYK